jgi:predicted HNH restriction endonuclease
MSRRLESTPRSKVRTALRRLWLRSRERSATLKAAGYSCQECGVKASRAQGHEQRVEVHHLDGVGNWETVIDAVFAQLLVHPSRLKAICPECHGKHHAKKAGL